MTQEKLKAFLVECLKVWSVKRVLFTAIGKLFDDEIEGALDSDPRFAAVVSGLLTGEDFDIIEDRAQLNCTVDGYIGLEEK